MDPLEQAGYTIGGGISVATVLAIVRLFFYWKKNTREDRKAQFADDTERKRVENEEAWKLVDRLQRIIDGTDERIRKVEDKCDQAVADCERREREANDRASRCEADHARTEGRLSIVEAWASAKGLKLPPQPGSGLHRSISQGDKS